MNAIEKTRITDIVAGTDACNVLERKVVLTGSGCMSYMTLGHGVSMLPHFHRHSEVMAITSGQGFLTIGERIFEVHSGSMFKIHARVPHRLVNITEKNLEWWSIAPRTSPKAQIVNDIDAKIVRSPQPQTKLRCDEMNLSCRLHQVNSFEMIEILHMPNSGWLYVLDGHGQMITSDKYETLRPGDGVHIDPYRRYEVINESGNGPLQMFSVTSPILEVATSHQLAA